MYQPFAAQSPIISCYSHCLPATHTMSARSSNHIDKSALRSAIQQQLRNEGVFNEITIAIRSRILQSLLNENGSSDAVPTATDNMSRQEMALLSLIYHSLEQKGMMHTLSVFAAESKMEQSLKYPLSSIDAVKALELEIIWNEFSKCNNGDLLPVDILTMLQAVAQWVSSQQERGASTTKTTGQASKSVQTDDKALAPAYNDGGDVDPEHNKENTQCNIVACEQRGGFGANKSIEQRLIEIERECQQRMKKELDEKLRLSAKKQAAYATRRLEQKHKETMQSLRNQIVVERTQAQHRQEELIEHLSQQKAMAQKDSSEKEQMLDTIKLEKQTLQSEMDLLNEKVKQMQQRRFTEWTDERDTLQRTHSKSMNELNAQKRDLQKQINKVSLQKDAMRAKEMKLASLEQERDHLLSEIQDLRHQQTNSQSLFDQTHSAQESNHQLTKADLDASRNEVKGLRALLKQSQAALEAVSFRQVGKAGASMSSPLAVYNRSTVLTASQLGHRATVQRVSGDVAPFRRPRLPSRNNAMNTDVNLYQQENPANNISDPTLTNSQHQVSSKNNMNPDVNLHLQESISNEKKGHDTQPVSREDPPCSSAEDPPGTTEHNEMMNYVKKEDEYNVENGDTWNSVDTVVGKEIQVLNLSAIPEQVRSEKEFVATSDNCFDHHSIEEDVTVKSSSPETSPNEATDIAEDEMAADKKTVNEQGTDQAQIGDQPVDTPVFEDELDRSEEGSMYVENGLITELEYDKLERLNQQRKIESEASVKNVQPSTTSIASEAIHSESYSECFDTFTSPQKNSMRLEGEDDNMAQHAESSNLYQESPLSASSDNSSSGYSESFFSEE